MQFLCILIKLTKIKDYLKKSNPRVFSALKISDVTSQSAARSGLLKCRSPARQQNFSCFARPLIKFFQEKKTAFKGLKFLKNVYFNENAP